MAADQTDMPVDLTTLPPTAQLLLDVLVARHRLGEQVWTFPNIHRAAVTRLEATGLVWAKPGPVERTLLVGLTSRGREECMSDSYQPPADPTVVVSVDHTAAPGRWAHVGLWVPSAHVQPWIDRLEEDPWAAIA